MSFCHFDKCENFNYEKTLVFNEGLDLISTTLFQARNETKQTEQN